WHTVADEGETRSAESDELVGVDGNLAGVAIGFGGTVLHKVSGHPVVLAGGEAFDGLAEVAAKQRGTAFARGANKRHGEALIESHGDQRGLAVARDAFDANVLRIDGRVGFEIVERAAGSPGPRTQSSPVIGFARLALVDEADDAARKPCAVISLNGRWVKHREAPAGGGELPRIGRVAVGVHLRELKRCGLNGSQAG